MSSLAVQSTILPDNPIQFSNTKGCLLAADSPLLKAIAVVVVLAMLAIGLSFGGVFGNTYGAIIAQKVSVGSFVFSVIVLTGIASVRGCFTREGREKRFLQFLIDQRPCGQPSRLSPMQSLQHSLVGAGSNSKKKVTLTDLGIIGGHEFAKAAFSTILKNVENVEGGFVRPQQELFSLWQAPVPLLKQTRVKCSINENSSTLYEKIKQAWADDSYEHLFSLSGGYDGGLCPQLDFNETFATTDKDWESFVVVNKNPRMREIVEMMLVSGGFNALHYVIPELSQGKKESSFFKKGYLQVDSEHVGYFKQCFMNNGHKIEFPCFGFFDPRRVGRLKGARPPVCLMIQSSFRPKHLNDNDTPPDLQQLEDGFMLQKLEAFAADLALLNQALKMKRQIDRCQKKLKNLGLPLLQEKKGVVVHLNFESCINSLHTPNALLARVWAMEQAIGLLGDSLFKAEIQVIIENMPKEESFLIKMLKK